MRKPKVDEKKISARTLKMLEKAAKWGTGLPCYGFMYEQKVPDKLKKH